jgi:hypothetical protein
MATTRFHFNALLKRINPTSERLHLAKTLPGEVREWLEEHEFETADPHTRLTGSYARHVAILDIPDVDVLLFVSEEERDNTPESLLRRVKSLLDEYPDTSIAAGQRRSVRLEFPLQGLHLDIVPAIAANGLEEPLEVPSRATKDWLASDPLGYARSLSQLNGDRGGKLVPLIKLVKTWRDVQMQVRRPKSYLLEVIVFQALEGEHVITEDRGMAAVVAGFFEYVADKWAELMDQGTGVPRVFDPQLGNLLSGNWERSHFETFMRRVGEAKKAALKAVAFEEDDDLTRAAEQWQSIFGEYWPSENEVKQLARDEAGGIQPGSAWVAPTGSVTGSGVGVRSKPTRNYGD